MHVCVIPGTCAARRRWWTCGVCGQLWTGRYGVWRMVAAEANNIGGAR